MVTVVCVGVVMDPAGPVIQQMGRNYQYYSHRQYPDLVAMPYLLGKQKEHSYHEDAQRAQAVVMFPVAMPE